LAARGALTGEPHVNKSSGARRASQDDLAESLREHPGSKAAEIARAFELPLANISQHLYRGKHGRFESRGDGWHIRDEQST
jgi:predicted RNA polymerase sigma factor